MPISIDRYGYVIKSLIINILGATGHKGRGGLSRVTVGEREEIMPVSFYLRSKDTGVWGERDY